MLHTPASPPRPNPPAPSLCPPAVLLPAGIEPASGGRHTDPQFVTRLHFTRDERGVPTLCCDGIDGWCAEACTWFGG